MTNQPTQHRRLSLRLALGAVPLALLSTLVPSAGAASAYGQCPDGWSVGGPEGDAQGAYINATDYTVPGAKPEVPQLRLLPGDTATILLYVARRFDSEVERLRSDVGGYFARKNVNDTSKWSNHACGIAIDLNSGLHPNDHSGTFTADQVVTIRDILSKTQGVVRWGGDYTKTKDEMHFEINRSPGDSDISSLARELGGQRPALTPATGVVGPTTVGAATGGIDAASWADGRVDLFTRSSSNELIHYFYERGKNNNAWLPAGGEHLGGTLYSDPSAVAPAVGTLDVFVRNGAGSISYKHKDATHSWPTSYRLLDGQIGGGPDVASWTTGRLDLFARSATGNHLLHRWSNDGGTSWSGYEDLTSRLSGPMIVGDPSAVSWGPSRLDVFGRGANNDLVHYYYDAAQDGLDIGQGPTHWLTEVRAADIVGDPSVSSWGPGRLDVLAKWSDGELGRTYLDRSLTPKWAASWLAWAPSFTGKPAALSMTVGRFDAFTNSAGALQQRYSTS